MGAKILLVEDNENNRYLATFLLERHGFTVIAAQNGREALERARAEAPELILLDIQMPEMDGYETAERLKADPELAAIPVVGVSSFAMVGDRERALALGFSGYLEKPIDPATFVDQVRAYLRSERTPGP
ncbi:MAG: response regulator [Deltaproteobacteria bacterium]|nr:response regulator [Deltaproteobacteria bacterium]